MDDKLESLKICKRCKQTLLISMFHNCKKYLDGKNIYCKDCSRYMQKKSREKRELEEYKMKRNQQENPQPESFKKTCTKCEVEKGISNFHKSKRSKDGYDTVCAECRRKREAENLIKRLEKRGY